MVQSRPLSALSCSKESETTSHSKALIFLRAVHTTTSTGKSLYVREELDGTTQCANKHMLSTPGLGEVHDYRDVLLRLRSSPCYVFAER